jgi:MFS family permease
MLARTVQGLLLLGTRMFQQGNRNLLGLVMVFMAKDLGFGVGERGSLLSAIAAGYFFTQIPGGALADKMGAKLVMCAAAAAAARCSHLRTAELVCVCVGQRPILHGPERDANP